MRVVHVTYVQVDHAREGRQWLKEIDFFCGIPEAMSKVAEVFSIHAINGEGVVKQNGVQYEFMRMTRWRRWFPLRIHRHIRALRPDAVIVHGLIFPWQVLWLQQVVGRQVKIWIQHHAEKPLRFHRALLQRWVDRSVTGYFFSAHALATPWLQASQIRDPSRIHEVMEISSWFRQAKDRPVNPGRYIWVGRFDRNKDPLTLVEGFMKFSATVPGVTLHIVYRGGDLLPDVLAALERDPLIAQRITLEENVPHDALQERFNAATFIISTSHAESGGTAVCEGMACGCIPILTDIPSFRMMTDHGRVGPLFTPGDVDALITALHKSQHVNIAAARANVLTQFESRLSFNAIAKGMINAINR